VRVLVSGGAGFIGSHVVEGLLADGHEVAVLDNLSSGKRENVPPGATLFVKDLRDRAGTAEVVREFRPECQAGSPRPWRYGRRTPGVFPWIAGAGACRSPP
jgi:nucleoside-diphosphate-sugar epimerase